MSSATNDAVELDGLVKFGWEMVPAGGGPAAGAGFDVMLLDDDGRITIDFQFVEP